MHTLTIGEVGWDLGHGQKFQEREFSSGGEQAISGPA
jgi:hypothetical protein